METVLILGGSPYLDLVQDKISKLIEKYATIAINETALKFKAHISFFYDNVVEDLARYDYFKDRGKIVTNNKNISSEDLIKAKITNCELYKPIADVIDLNKNSNVLGFAGFAITSCLNWCLKQGTKTIYLIGHDLPHGKWNYSNIDGSDYPYKIYTPSNSKIKRARNYIYSISKYLNIYQINPDSDLKLPKIPINLL